MIVVTTVFTRDFANVRPKCISRLKPLSFCIINFFNPDGIVMLDLTYETKSFVIFFQVTNIAKRR